MRFLRTPDDRFDRIVMANGACPTRASWSG